MHRSLFFCLGKPTCARGSRPSPVNSKFEILVCFFRADETTIEPIGCWAVGITKVRGKAPVNVSCYFNGHARLYLLFFSPLRFRDVVSPSFSFAQNRSRRASLSVRRYGLVRRTSASCGEWIRLRSNSSSLSAAISWNLTQVYLLALLFITLIYMFCTVCNRYGWLFVATFVAVLPRSAVASLSFLFYDILCTFPEYVPLLSHWIQWPISFLQRGLWWCTSKKSMNAEFCTPGRRWNLFG